jgi:hypothetical protein
LFVLFVGSLFTWPHVSRSIDCHGLLIHLIYSSCSSTGWPCLFRSSVFLHVDPLSTLALAASLLQAQSLGPSSWLASKALLDPLLVVGIHSRGPLSIPIGLHGLSVCSVAALALLCSPAVERSTPVVSTPPDSNSPVLLLLVRSGMPLCKLNLLPLGFRIL